MQRIFWRLPFCGTGWQQLPYEIMINKYVPGNVRWYNIYIFLLQIKFESKCMIQHTHTYIIPRIITFSNKYQTNYQEFAGLFAVTLVGSISWVLDRSEESWRFSMVWMIMTSFICSMIYLWLKIWCEACFQPILCLRCLVYIVSRKFFT